MRKLSIEPGKIGEIEKIIEHAYTTCRDTSTGWEIAEECKQMALFNLQRLFAMLKTKAKMLAQLLQIEDSEVFIISGNELRRDDVTVVRFSR